jgi:hypothetical protein
MFAGVKHVGVMTAAFLLLLRFTGQGPCEPPPYFRAGVNLSLDYAVLGGSLSGDAYAMSPYPPPGPYAGLGYSPYPASYFSTPPYLNPYGNPYPYPYGAGPFNDPYGGYLRGAAKIITPPAGHYVPPAKQSKEPRRP